MPIFDIQKIFVKKFEILPKMAKFRKRPKIVIGQQ